MQVNQYRAVQYSVLTKCYREAPHRFRCLNREPVPDRVSIRERAAIVMAIRISGTIEVVQTSKRCWPLCITTSPSEGHASLWMVHVTERSSQRAARASLEGATYS